MLLPSRAMVTSTLPTTEESCTYFSVWNDGGEPFWRVRPFVACRVPDRKWFFLNNDVYALTLKTVQMVGGFTRLASPLASTDHAHDVCAYPVLSKGSLFVSEK